MLYKLHVAFATLICYHFVVENATIIFEEDMKKILALSLLVSLGFGYLSPSYAVLEKFSKKQKEQQQTTLDYINYDWWQNLGDNYKENKTKQILHKVTPTHCGTGKDVILPGSYWKPLWYAKHKSKNNYEQMLNNDNFKQHANVVSYDDAEGSLEFTKKLIKLNSERKEEKS